MILDRFITAGRRSALSLYRPDIATMESGESMAEWSVGILEYWSDGFAYRATLRLHYSITPLVLSALKAMVEKQAKRKA